MTKTKAEVVSSKEAKEIIDKAIREIMELTERDDIGVVSIILAVSIELNGDDT